MTRLHLNGERLRRVLSSALVVSFGLLVSCGGEEAEPVSPDTTDGGELFALRALGGEPGCVTCHSTEADHVLVGPSLAGVGARAGDRVADLDVESYLRESILDPRAYSVDGFDPDKMPTSFGRILSPDQVDALIDYLLELE